MSSNKEAYHKIMYDAIKSSTGEPLDPRYQGTLSVMVEFIDVWDLVTIQFNLFVVVFL